MTKQIVIKLNEQRFKPLLDALQEKEVFCGCLSYSETVGKIILALYNFSFLKLPDGTTPREKLLEGYNKDFGMNLDFSKLTIAFNKFYKHFIETGEICDMQKFL